MSPQTFYRWKQRYHPYHLESLEDRPCPPEPRSNLLDWGKVYNAFRPH
ncbi:MAG: hypothetical protein E3J55_03400 [Dehalococcoidia bacterium]|nr:MAG: hypothetical protein E3J55_03400 [Dehalococcoidia bacterium]